MLKLATHLFFPVVLLVLILMGATGSGNIYAALITGLSLCLLLFLLGMREDGFTKAETDYTETKESPEFIDSFYDGELSPDLARFGRERCD